MTSRRIQLRRTKGWKKPEGAVVVSRPSKWGNPFEVKPLPADVFGPDQWTVRDRNDRVRGLREEPQTFPSKHDATVFAVRFFELHIGPMGSYEYEPEDNDLRELQGKDLACWCPLNEPCHADVLLKIANPA